jgi:prevent-host-death family protein
MISTNISTIKSRLSSYIDQVKCGETVIISDRTHPVAVLAPYRPHDGGGEWGPRLAELVRRGMAATRVERDTSFKIKPRDVGRETRLVEAILEERASGR